VLLEGWLQVDHLPVAPQHDAAGEQLAVEYGFGGLDGRVGIEKLLYGHYLRRVESVLARLAIGREAQRGADQVLRPLPHLLGAARAALAESHPGRHATLGVLARLDIWLAAALRRPRTRNPPDFRASRCPTSS
jgi:hypothetical protein